MRMTQIGNKDIGEFRISNVGFRVSGKIDEDISKN